MPMQEGRAAGRTKDRHRGGSWGLAAVGRRIQFLEEFRDAFGVPVSDSESRFLQFVA
jgi:hypothetical protein